MKWLFILAGAFFIAGAMLAGCDENASNQSQISVSGSQDNQSCSASVLIPFNVTAHNMLIDDIDGNGLKDLAFTSHHDSYSQVFYQTTQRDFIPGPIVEEVGFHPGELLRLPHDNRRLYLMNAEGVNRLIVFESVENRKLLPISQVPMPSARNAELFEWPDWGLGLAVAPYARGSLFLLKDFDPETARFIRGYELPYVPALAPIYDFAVADIDGDGVDELLFTNSTTNDLSMVRAPVGEAEPKIEKVWNFEPGGRPQYVVPADLDRDGDLDLLVPDSTSKRLVDRTSINVLVNQGSGEFEQIEIPFPAPKRSEGGVSGVRAMDYAIDQDNRAYILASGYTLLSLIHVPLDWPASEIEMLTLPYQGEQAVSQALLDDVDGDGWLDAVVSRPAQENSGMIIYGPLWENMQTSVRQACTVN